MKLFILILFCALIAMLAPAAHAQQGNGNYGPVEFVTANPSGNCTQAFFELTVNKNTGVMFACTAGTWAQVNPVNGLTPITIAGTANQITATGAACTVGGTGTCTLSLPTALTVTGVTASGTVKAATYQSSDGTAGVTVTTCSGFKSGLCVAGS